MKHLENLRNHDLSGPSGQMRIRRGSLRESDPSYQILPTGIGTEIIEHRHGQFYDSKHSLLERGLKIVEPGVLVAEPCMNHGKIEWGNVSLPR